MQFNVLISSMLHMCLFIRRALMGTSNKRVKMALYCSPDYQPSFKSVGLSVQDKFNIDFQGGICLGFPI